MAEVTVYLGLGSNIGDRESNILDAVNKLTTSSKIDLLRSSAIYQTEPWGLGNQPKFLNSVLEIKTNLSPISLLTYTQTIETMLGRQKQVRFGPRLIDIDILLYGDQSVYYEEPNLQIPHPRMHIRSFVLTPLAELIPNHVIKQFGTSIMDLSTHVEGHEGVIIWKTQTF